MASRLAKSALGATRIRPTLPLRTNLPALTTFTTSPAHRQEAKEPKDVATSILNSLPGNSIASKTAILSAGAGLSIAAISNELYVVNEESIVFLSLLTIYWGVYNYAGPMYRDWAKGQEDKVKGILNSARADHENAVKARIDNVKDLSGVIDITKDLFAVSKETAQLEARAYELQQKADVAAEAKAVLDSWVRYESQVKSRQQTEIANAVIAKVEKELENPKVLDQILKQAVTDVEKILQQQAKQPQK